MANVDGEETESPGSERPSRKATVVCEKVEAHETEGSIQRPQLLWVVACFLQGGSGEFDTVSCFLKHVMPLTIVSIEEALVGGTAVPGTFSAVCNDNQPSAASGMQNRSRHCSSSRNQMFFDHGSQAYSLTSSLASLTYFPC